MSQELDLFPEALTDYILPKLQALEKEIVLCERTIRKEIIRSRSMQDGWLLRESLKLFEIPELLKLKKERIRLKRLIPMSSSYQNTLSQKQIDLAKRFPIYRLAEGRLRSLKRSGNNYRSLCPYHDERTPSFYLYTNTNTYHCFGCQKHGDAISLAKKLYNYTFIEAVERLSKKL